MEFGKQEASRCVHGQPAFCTAACPFDLNVRDFATRIERGRTDAAYRIFRDAVAFPFIVSQICPAPCQQACIRTKTDESVQLHALERSVCANARNTKATRYNVPKKQGRIAVIGAGLSGLGCALRLGMMHYDVAVYEKTDRIGGQLNGVVPEEILQKDFNTQFAAVEYTLHRNVEINNLDLGADAYYIATGMDGQDFGLLHQRDGNLVSGSDNVLLGGSITGADSMTALAHGLLAAQAIDAYFKTGMLEAPKNKAACTSLCFDESKLIRTSKIAPSGERYTEAEMAEEAQRCLKCDCDICQKTCDLMGYYEKYPARIVDEVEITVHPTVMFGHRIATRLIGSCTKCGVCVDTCPKAIDMQTFLLMSRREMERMGDMPKAWSSFWLDDMAHANGDRAALTLLPQGQKASRAFFPGCQLGASDPRYVSETYSALMKDCPDTGLLLGCCGAPAYWAGREDLHRVCIDQLKKNWQQMGEPTLLLACPTCKKMLLQFLPEITTEFVYPRLKNAAAAGHGQTYSVFDPCSTRHDPMVQNCVRGLLKDRGHMLSPLPIERENALCCGYGGQTMIANPHFTDHVTNHRISQSPNVYVTYCTNCRDVFAAKGKQALHVLDVVFALDDGWRKPPTWTKRRENREALKRGLQHRLLTEETEMIKPQVTVAIGEDVMQKLQRDYILKEDIEIVIEFCERTGCKLIDPKTGHRIGHLNIGYMTFWAEYAKDGEGYILYDAYAHRMKIQEDDTCKQS